MQTKIFLVIFAIFFYHNGFAAQLGKIDVKSNQGSLFDAEINLILDKGDDLKNMKASIAPQEVYNSQGMKRQPIHSDIKINLNNTGTNSALVILKSSNPVKESFVDLLIQIDSPKGKVLKEYTVLLDPPLPQSEKLSNKIAEKNNSQSLDSDESSKKVTKQKKKKTLTTRSGKTLFQISRENNIAGITTEQFAVAIFQLNPKAFAKKNINGLKKGQKIFLPDEEYFKNLSHLKARKILREQNLQWNKKDIKNIQTNKRTTKNKVVSESNQNEIKKLNAEINRLKDALKRQKALTEQIKTTLDEEKKVEKEILKEVKSEVKSISEEKTETKSQDDQLGKIDEQDFVSSIAIEDEVVIEEVFIDDPDQTQNNPRSGLIYFLLVLFTILGGLLVFLSKKRAKLKTVTEEIQPRTSVEEYIYRKKNGQDFNRK